MEVGRCIKSVIRGQRHRCGVVAIGLPLIRRGGEKALIDPPRSGKMTVIRRRFGRFGSVGGGRATSLRLSWATGCPLPSGVIMPLMPRLEPSVTVPGLRVCTGRLSSPHMANMRFMALCVHHLAISLTLYL